MCICKTVGAPTLTMGCCGSKAFVPTPKAITLGESLGLTIVQIHTLGAVFTSLDYLKDKHVFVVDVVEGLHLHGASELVKLVLRLHDRSGHDKMTFDEFLIAVWALCSLGKADLPRFCFSLFDLGGDGTMSSQEIAFFAYLLWNFSPSPGVEKLALDLQMQGEQNVSLDDFFTSAVHSGMLFMQVVEMQLVFMSRTLGMGAWAQLADQRTRQHGHKSVFQILKVLPDEEAAMKIRGLSRVEPRGPAAHPVVGITEKLNECKRQAEAERREVAHRHELHDKKKAQIKASHAESHAHAHAHGASDHDKAAKGIDQNHVDAHNYAPGHHEPPHLVKHDDHAKKSIAALGHGHHHAGSVSSVHLDTHENRHHDDHKINRNASVGANSKEPHHHTHHHHGGVHDEASLLADVAGHPTHAAHAHAHGHGHAHGGHKHEHGGHHESHKPGSHTGSGRSHCHHDHDEGPHDLKHAMASNFKHSSHRDATHDATHAHIDAHRQHELEQVKLDGATARAVKPRPTHGGAAFPHETVHLEG